MITLLKDLAFTLCITFFFFVMLAITAVNFKSTQKYVDELIIVGFICGGVGLLILLFGHLF